MVTPNPTIVPKIHFGSHSRTPSQSPSRSPTRQRMIDDILSDLSPATTLEAFTSDSPSGKLRASIEAATPGERAFGIRATLASKKIQEWVDELKAWPWPDENAAAGGFELPAAKRIKLDPDLALDTESQGSEEGEYMGSLPARDVLAYERRIDDIQDDMDDLDVEGIKQTVLNTHFSPRSRPSSAASEIAPMPSSLLGYTKMDDFTAVVTATVLRSLPFLSQLMRLMDVWTIRLGVLRKVPPLLGMLDDAENALRSGWQAISLQHGQEGGVEALDRTSFETMRDVLQDIVTTLGRDLDYMLDTLEGRRDTLPERWLDRMEGIEREYGEWVVAGDRRVREGEWMVMAKRRKEEEERRRAEAMDQLEKERVRREERDRLMFEDEARKVVRLENERLRKVEEDRTLAEEEAREVAKLEEERLQKLEDDRLKAEEAARDVAEMVAERLRKVEEYRLMAEQEAAELEAQRVQEFLEDIRKAERPAREAAQLEETALEAKVTRQEEESFGAEVLELRAERAPRDREEAKRLKEARPDEVMRLQKQHARSILETRTQDPDTDTPGSVNPELPTLAPLKFVELPPKEAECCDPDHDVSQDRSPLVSDLLVAAGASSLAAALGLKVHGSDGEQEREEDKQEHIKRQSSLISRYAPFDGTTESKVEDAETIHEKVDDHCHVANDIPLYSWQKELRPSRDLATPQDIVLESVGKAPAPTSTHEGATNDLDPRPSSKDLVDPASAPPSPVSPLKSKIEGVPSLANPWEAEVPQQSASTQDLFSYPDPVSEFTRETIKDDAPSTPPLETKEPPTNINLKIRLPIAPMIGEDANPTFFDHNINHFNESKTPTTESSGNQKHLRSDDNPYSKNGHNRNDSAVSALSNMSAVNGYLTSEPSPEIHEAEPAEYFRPVLSPIRSSRSYGGSGPPTPLQIGVRELPVALQRTESPQSAPIKGYSNPDIEELLTRDSGLDLDNDGTHLSKVEKINLLELASMDPAVLVEKSPTDSINSINHLEVSRRNSNSSNDSTIITKLIGDSTFPLIPSSPVSIADTTEPFPDVDSPSTGRIGLRNHPSRDYSPPDSPPSIPEMSKRRLLHLSNTPNLIPSSSSDAPITPTLDEPPSFPSLEISPAPFSSPKKATTTDDQLQVQISTLLESIPARIRLTSEPDTDSSSLSFFSSSQNDTLKPKKTRRSLTPSIRSTSSMSMRAPTPSFTLAPAYSKSAPRPRHQNGNPEIKLYHLSGSTGEAPIKLFVRLVGENGERVMVRVGGGWADLGEYLREYASHHSRRVVSGHTSDDKVEIQGLPSRRDVSNSSVASSNATVRGHNGRSSPNPPRPNSVLERERPLSSLYIRKTRKSVGEQSESSTSILNLPSPSTPLPNSPPRQLTSTSNANSNTSNRSYDTPPSGRSVSHLSWTEEDSVLGLAGPKSKPKAISERDAEWVESMKEKVRLASAEKERKEGKEDGRKSFGELEKVGGTKRLFKKGS